MPQRYPAGLSGAIITQTGGVILNNLYTNPQEDESVGIRHIPISVIFGTEIQRYLEVLKKYSIKGKISF